MTLKTIEQLKHEALQGKGCLDTTMAWMAKMLETKIKQRSEVSDSAAQAYVEGRAI
jgi:hypothetical protein